MYCLATAVSKSFSLPLLCCICLNTQGRCSQCTPPVGQSECPCGMLMSSFWLLHTPLSLYDLCVQQSRGSLVMGLARLAEDMMGVLMCQQVVLPNDGRAGVGGMWDDCLRPPLSNVPPFLHSSFSELSLSLFSPQCLFKEEARNRLEFLTCPSSYLAASSLLCFSMCEEILAER